MKAIIWDMDGTLTDTERYWTQLPLRMLEHFGVPEPLGKAAPWFRTSVSASLEAYLASPSCRLSMTLEQCECWCRNYMYTHTYAQGAPMKPFARETLEAARALGVPMCLLSATERQALHYTLYRLDMVGYFDFWFSTCFSARNKQREETFHWAAERLGVRARDCLLVEDSLYAMRTGKRAGCAVWAVEDPKHERDKPAIIALADRYFTDHRDLARALKEEFARDDRTAVL